MTINIYIYMNTYQCIARISLSIYVVTYKINSEHCIYSYDSLPTFN